MEHLISVREMGQFPLSIPTSLALEGAIGIYPERETGINVLPDYDEMWINLRTLFRNLMGSMKSEEAAAVTPTPVAEALLQEMEHLESIVKERSAGRIHLVFYVSNYRGLEAKYPKAYIRKDSTPKQIIRTEIQKKAIQHLLDLLKEQGGHDVRVFELKLKTAKPTKALILTHFAYDLFVYPQFAELELLESHTGVIKPKSLWYTKYVDGKTLPMIPFREDFIQIFGDAETFSPWPIKHRRQIIELAEKHHWTQITTKALIEYNLSLMHSSNPFLVDTLKTMMV
jgi:hypothetical protein